MSRWQKIVVHHSATKDGIVNDWVAIKRYHTSYRIDGVIVSKEEFLDRSMKHKGTLFEEPDRDIAYHFGIEQISGKLLLQIGRSLDMDGAHTKGQNQTSIGICCIGNYDLAPPSVEMKDLLVDVLTGLCFIFKISPIEIYPHSKFAVKTCPGKLFPLSEIQTRVGVKFAIADIG
jgi:hypothetical protein